MKRPIPCSPPKPQAIELVFALDPAGTRLVVLSLYKSRPVRCLLVEVDTEGHDSHPWADELYDACAAQVLLYGRALGLSHAEAEDVLHDTFRALLELETPPRQPRFYVIRSFRNRALNHRRSLWRRLLRELESARWFEPQPDVAPAERAAVAALARLPREQREVIVLKLWHDLTFETIGQLLELSPHTAAGRYRYGLRKLRTILDQESHESPDDLRDPTAWLPPSPAVPEN